MYFRHICQYFFEKILFKYSIPAKQIPGIYLFGHISQLAVISVGNNHLRHGLELSQVIHHPAAKEILECSLAS